VVNPEQHNERRREQKRKQSAIARAKAAHKSRNDEKADFDFTYFGEFTAETNDNMIWSCKENERDFIDKRGIWQLVKGKKIHVRVLDNQHLLAGKTITVTQNGFMGEDGKPIKEKIRTLVVTLVAPLAISFNWTGRRGQKPKMVVN
jgi:hypothetical protein